MRNHPKGGEDDPPSSRLTRKTAASSGRFFVRFWRSTRRRS
jgi:hypothetical protein